jgi:hypothetical protein
MTTHTISILIQKGQLRLRTVAFADEYRRAVAFVAGDTAFLYADKPSGQLIATKAGETYQDI